MKRKFTICASDSAKKDLKEKKDKLLNEIHEHGKTQRSILDKIHKQKIDDSEILDFFLSEMQYDDANKILKKFCKASSIDLSEDVEGGCHGTSKPQRKSK